ncbi:MAG TPA: S41 family peptidase [Gemmataceae bacterium]|jgi:C-terminal peptidase prc
MRVVSAWCLALSAAAAAVSAATVPSPGPAGVRSSPDHALRSEAESYARNIAAVVMVVEESYVRPVSRADLYEAALTGLYEAVRQPVPAGLRAEIQQGVEGDLHGMLARVRESLGHHEALRGQKAILVSLQTLPRALDPYCGLAGRREFQRLDSFDNVANTGLEFVGVPLTPVGPAALVPRGVRIVPSDPSPADAQPAPAGPLRVQNVQPGSPAQRAGIRPGDLITRLNGLPPESPSFAALFQRLRPLQPGVPIEQPDAPVRLTVLRPGRAEPLELAVAPTSYHPESVFGARRRADGDWDYMLDHAGKIGYVRVGGIRRQTDQELLAALRSLRASSVRGLVLDLRWCPGGYLDEAKAIARLFLPQQLPADLPLAWQQKRVGGREAMSAELLDAPYRDFPVVVLINGETSGGGELIAAALQDHKRAAVAGQRTVGKGSIQNTPPKLDIPFKVTVNMFLRPDGRNLQRFPDSKPTDDWGVRPDPGRELPLTADAGERLKEWSALATLRPAGSTEALPLDDPENDPQRLAAVQMLREMIKK